MPSFNESNNVLSSDNNIHEEHEDIVSLIREKKDVIPNHGVTVTIQTDYKMRTDEKYYLVIFRKGTRNGTIIRKDLTIFDESLPVDKNIITARIQKKFFKLYAQYHYDFGDSFSLFGNMYTLIVEQNVSHARCCDCYSCVTREMNNAVLDSYIPLKMILLADIMRECDCETFL